MKHVKPEVTDEYLSKLTEFADNEGKVERERAQLRDILEKCVVVAREGDSFFHYPSFISSSVARELKRRNISVEYVEQESSYLISWNERSAS